MEMDEGHVQAAAMPWAHLRLPPFPQVAVKVLQLARDENVQLHQLCDLISSDPAFASEVLSVANSLLYAPRYPSTSILQAVAVLGANTLQGMCVTVGVRAYLGKTMSYPAMRNLWRHNLACAIVAQRLAAVGFIDKDTAFTAGILHDVGRMGLAVIQPAAYAALLEKHQGARRHCSTPSACSSAGITARQDGNWSATGSFRRNSNRWSPSTMRRGAQTERGM